MWNYFKKQIASSDLGVYMSIIPTLRQEFQRGQNYITAITKRYQVKKIQHMPNLSEALLNLEQCADGFFSSIKQEENIEKFAHLISKYIQNYESIEAFKSVFDKSNAMKEIKDLGNFLIGSSGLSRLANILHDIQNYDKLSSEQRNNILQQLNDRALINEMICENTTLTLTNLGEKFDRIDKSLKNDLQVNQADRIIILDLFKEICNNYLVEFLTARHLIVRELPEYFKNEVKNIQSRPTWEQECAMPVIFEHSNHSKKQKNLEPVEIAESKRRLGFE